MCAGTVVRVGFCKVPGCGFVYRRHAGLSISHTALNSSYHYQAQQEVPHRAPPLFVLFLATTTVAHTTTTVGNTSMELFGYSGWRGWLKLFGIRMISDLRSGFPESTSSI